MTFSFSLYTIPLQVTQIIYFEWKTQDRTNRKVYWKMGSILLLILEVSNSFSQFLGSGTKWTTYLFMISKP